MTKDITPMGVIAAAQMIGYTAMAYLNGDNINPTKYDQYRVSNEVQNELIESASNKRSRKDRKRYLNHLKSIGGMPY